MDTMSSEDMDPYFLQASLLVDSILDKAIVSLSAMDEELENIHTLEQGVSFVSTPVISFVSTPVIGEASPFHEMPMESIGNIEWPANEGFTQSVGESSIEEFVKRADLLEDQAAFLVEHILRNALRIVNSVERGDGNAFSGDVKRDDSTEVVPTKANLECPSIDNFTVPLGRTFIAEFIKTWEVECSWLYCIDYLGVDDHQFDIRHRYRVRWSVPTRRKPIPRSTASVYFTCSVSKVKPKTHSIDVLYVLEGNQLVHRPGESRFREQWLKDIINNKAAMIKMVDF